MWVWKKLFYWGMWGQIFLILTLHRSGSASLTSRIAPIRHNPEVCLDRKGKRQINDLQDVNLSHTMHSSCSFLEFVPWKRSQPHSSNPTHRTSRAYWMIINRADQKVSNILTLEWWLLKLSHQYYYSVTVWQLPANYSTFQESYKHALLVCRGRINAGIFWANMMSLNKSPNGCNMLEMHL